MESLNITKIKEIYDFEKEKIFVTDILEETVKRFKSAIEKGVNVAAYKEEILYLEEILASDELIEKAAIMHTLETLNIILREACPEFNARSQFNKLKRTSNQPISAFGRTFVIEDKDVRSYTIEDFRKMLFAAVGLEFTPASEIVDVANELNMFRRNNGNAYNLEKTIEKLSCKTLINPQYNYDVFSNDWGVIDNLNFKTLPISTKWLYPINVVKINDEFIPKRIVKNIKK